jgi:hypothetical protein
MSLAFVALAGAGCIADLPVVTRRENVLIA